MGGNSYSKLPGGDIEASSFVKLDSSNTGRVLQCAAGETVYGISQPATRRIALDSYDSSLCGALGDPAINIYGPTSDTGVLLRLGGTVANGDYIKAGTSGFGVKATTDKDAYGARALAAGVAGDLIPVEVVIGFLAA